MTAFFGIDHAESLAIVLPVLLRHQKTTKAAKLEQYARRIWNVSEPSPEAAVEQGIARTVAFFHSLGMKTRLADYGIAAADAAEKISRRFTQHGDILGEHGDLTPERVAAILREC